MIEQDNITLDTRPAWHSRPVILWVTIGVLAVTTLSLGVIVATTQKNVAVNVMGPPVEDRLSTMKYINAGENVTAHVEYTKASMTTPVVALSSAHLTRYDLHVKGADSAHFAAGRTDIHATNSTKEVTHKMWIEVTDAARFGEFATVHGQVGPRTLRIKIKNMETGDSCYVVPFGASMVFLNPTHNSTLTPNFFYFSCSKNDTFSVNTTVQSFASTLNGTEFWMNRGAAEWNATVSTWLERYWAAANADRHTVASSGRRLMNADYGGGEYSGGSSSSSYSPPSSNDASEGQAIGSAVGSKVGGWAGGKIGSDIGGDVGTDVGTDVGGAVGGAIGSLAGPIGTAIGTEVGSWAGGDLGGYLGKKYGGELGSDIGSKVGSDVGGDLGSDIGSYF